MGCFKGIAKILLIVSNFAILVCAVILITFGVVYKMNNVGLDIMSISTYAIAVGAVIVLIAFIGCYGACAGSSCLLTTYAGIFLAIFIAQVVLGVMAFLAIRNSEDQLLKQVETYLTKIYDKISEQEQMDIVNTLQKDFECCGIKGPTDPQVLNGTTALIASCCDSDDTTTICTSNSKHVYQDGCAEQLMSFLEDNATIIGGIAVGFAIFELVAAGLACYARNNIDKRHGVIYS